MIEQLFNLIGIKAGVILSFAIVLLIAERLFPAARPLAMTRLNEMAVMARRLLKNVGLAGFNGLLGPLVVIPVSAYAAQWAPAWRPEFMAGSGGLVIDLIVLDCWIYWWHRVNHLVPFLWRFHEVHHLDQFLDVTSALRFHFGEVVLSAFMRAAVIFVFAVPLGHVVIFEITVMVMAMFQHCNAKIPSAIERPLSWLIVTPSLHWVHHHALRVDTDSNYANILSLWDRIFGSRSPNPRRLDMPIGVERMADRGFIKLLLRPFYRR